VNVGETVNWYAFSPDYKYFAICGSNGLQVFAYNAANTTFTAVDTTEEPSDNIVKVVWDGNNHLYALDAQSNSLFVYTVTDTAVTAVSGSPYAVQNPADLAVSSLTGGS
jgi:WD40 repeat protein